MCPLRSALVALVALVVTSCAIHPPRAPALAAGVAGPPPAYATVDTAPRARLHTEERGAGAPVVFLPGLTGTTAYYRDDVEPLAAQFRVVLVDLLGFGRSPKPAVRYDLERHVAELRRTLAGRGPVSLVGHSLGARVAVAYAARYPDDVERLVLLSLPYFPDSGGAIAYARRSGWARGLWTHRRVAATLFYLMHTLPAPVVHRAAAGHLPAEVVRESRAFTTRSATSSLWEAVFRHDLGPDIDRVPARIPVVLVHGERDATAPLEGALGAIARRPDWRLVVLPGVDHHPLLREPAVVTRLITRAPETLAASP